MLAPARSRLGRGMHGLGGCSVLVLYEMRFTSERPVDSRHLGCVDRRLVAPSGTGVGYELLNWKRMGVSAFLWHYSFWVR